MSIILGITGTCEPYPSSPITIYNQGTWGISTTGVTNTRNDYIGGSNCSATLGGGAGTYNMIIGTGITMDVSNMNSGCQTTGYIICRLNQTVNVTNYSYLTAESCVNGSRTYITVYIGLSTNSNYTSTSLTSIASNYYDAGTLSDGNSSKKTATLSSNISSLTGNYYIYFILQAQRNTTYKNNDAGVSFHYVKLANE